MNKGYIKGRRLELLAKRELEADGYFVIRSAASKGPFDLVAVSSFETRLIQVKTRKPSKREINKLKQISEKLYDVPVQIWIYKGKGQFETMEI